jgi:hypothetical protein
MDTQATLETAEAVINQTDAALEAIETSLTVVKNNPVVLAGVAVISLAVGAGAAVLFTKKHFRTKFEQIADKEIEETREHYKRKYKVGDYADPEKMAEDKEYTPEVAPDSDFDGFGEAYASDREVIDEDIKKTAEEIALHQKYSGGKVAYHKAGQGEVVEQTVEVTTRTRSIFENEYNAEEENEKRVAGKPYIVPVQKYMENEFDYSQSTWEWFSEDNTMTNERGDAVPNWQAVVGEENIKFGYASNDGNAVYIWNDRLKAGYEIVYNPSSYEIEQQSRTLTHSDRRSRRT